MPLSNVRYRVKTTRSGRKVRLAFRKGTNTVVEAKALDSGKTHTPAEFAADRRKAKRRKQAKKKRA